MNRPRTQAEWIEHIRRDVASHHVVMYAKGEKHAAVCGFSHRAMEVLDRTGVEYEVRNVLADPLLLDALCEYSQWPTVPQIFVAGTLVGGCDIVTEMYGTGELQRLVAGTRPQAPETSR